MQHAALRAMVEVTRETADTAKLFKGATDNWHADASVRADVRKKCRYEVINNAYLAGLVQMKQVDLIGTGPKLFVMGEDREACDEIEAKFRTWCNDIDLREKLMTLVWQWIVDGDSFGYMLTNNTLPNPVKLDLLTLDPEQIVNISDGDRQLEGITYDDYARPVSYQVLPRHPAGYDVLSDADSVPIAARWVVHLFTKERASQVRGLSRLSPSLIPAALLRSYTLAVVKAANIAASISFLVHTDEIGSDSSACEPYDLIDLEPGSGMALPDGYRATQLRAEQPTNTFAEFKGEMLNEIGRSLLVPSLKISGDASKYNYSSGRLDGQEYYHACDVERALIEAKVLEKILREWWTEATIAEGYLSPGAKAIVGRDDYPQVPAHRWGWDGRPHVDPSKEATADATRMAQGQLGLHEWFASQGLDAEGEMEKAARTLGLTLKEYQERIVAKIFGEPKDDTQEPTAKPASKGEE